MEHWAVFASRTWTAPGSGAHVAGPWRGVLHTTEGSSTAGAIAAYRTSGNYPHFTVSEHSIEQHCPINVGATALKHPTGAVETNRMSAVQIEIVGSCDKAYAAKYTIPYVPDFTAAQLANVAKVMRWVEEQTGIDFWTYPDFTAVSSASSAQRMSVQDWRTFNSWCGHEHVPNNSHWDPGTLNMQLLAPPRHDAPIVQEDKDMSKFVDEYRWGNGAVVRIDAQGRAYCYGLTYRGGVDRAPTADKKDWADGEGVVVPLDYLRPEAGYRIYSEDGSFKGDFNPEWAAAHL